MRASPRVRAVQLPLELTPLRHLPNRPFRTELTVEENSLFVANGYKDESFVRQTVVVHPDTREQVIQRMTVGKTHAGGRARGVLRQMHQDAFYSVLKLWCSQGHEVVEARGKRHGLVRTSAYELVSTIFPNNDNARSYNRARELLRDLQSIPIVLENVYTWRGLRDREELTLLSDVTWSERRLDDTGRPTGCGKSLITIMLSSLITEGFLASHFRVLLAEPYESLSQGRSGRRNEIARLLYPLLDRRLTHSESFQAPLSELSERYALKQYQHRSKRKEKFAPGVRLLEGQPIVEGRFVLHLDFVPTPDDYVLLASRVPRKK